MRAVLVEAEPGPVAIDPRTTALILIDMQRDFLEPGGCPTAGRREGLHGQGSVRADALPGSAIRWLEKAKGIGLAGIAGMDGSGDEHTLGMIQSNEG